MGRPRRHLPCCPFVRGISGIECARTHRKQRKGGEWQLWESNAIPKTERKRHGSRVSTDKQTTHNQRRELEAVAARSSWQVVKIYEDAGISGAKGRDKRPGLDAMLKAVNVREFDMVVAWSVDRLGRSLTDLLAILQSLHDKGVDLFLHQQGLDTSTSAGKAMFQMLGVFAEFERGIIRERVNAGLARARRRVRSWAGAP